MCICIYMSFLAPRLNLSHCHDGFQFFFEAEVATGNPRRPYGDL